MGDVLNLDPAAYDFKSAPVSSLTEIETVAHAMFSSVDLVDGQRDGNWNFKSDRSYVTEVNRDQQRMFYVAPDSDPTGASGAWEREWDGKNAQSKWSENAGTDLRTNLIQCRQAGRMFPGVKVHFEELVYESDSDVSSVLLEGVKIKGCGMGKTIFRQVVPTDKPMVTYKDGEPASIEELTIDANNLVVGTATFRPFGVSSFFAQNLEIIKWERGIELKSSPTTAIISSELINVRIHDPSTGGNSHPFDIGTPWGSPEMTDLVMRDCVAEGAYLPFVSTTTPGTADQIVLKNVQGAILDNCVSKGGGELGIALSHGSRNIEINGGIVSDNAVSYTHLTLPTKA